MANQTRSTGGSSPHTRGTLLACLAGRPVVRFIPAYAGNALPPLLAALGRTVHPRIRGERPSVRATTNVTNGSSPHTRGTPGRNDWRCTRERFIPAYAGNASGRHRTSAQRTVHPRIRGERPTRPPLGAYSAGSSPHTRGTPGPSFPPGADGRFIPAYAGNAKGGSDGGSPGAVHPRIRGERTSSKLLI